MALSEGIGRSSIEEIIEQMRAALHAAISEELAKVRLDMDKQLAQSEKDDAVADHTLTFVGVQLEPHKLDERNREVEVAPKGTICYEDSICCTPLQDEFDLSPAITKEVFIAIPDAHPHLDVVLNEQLHPSDFRNPSSDPQVSTQHTTIPLPTSDARENAREDAVGKMDFPQFDGEDARTWLDKCASYFTLYNIPEYFRVTAATLHFSGRASHWFQSCKEVVINLDWVQFRQAVLAEFEVLTHENKILELLTLKQSGSVEDFRKDFECLVYHVRLFENSLSDTFLVTLFVHGLKHELRALVEVQFPDSVAKAACLAAEHEKFLEKQSAVHLKLGQVISSGKGANSQGDVEKAEQPKEYRRSNGQSFSCGGKYMRDHKCKIVGQPKLNCISVDEGSEAVEIISDDILNLLESSEVVSRQQLLLPWNAITDTSLRNDVVIFSEIQRQLKNGNVTVEMQVTSDSNKSADEVIQSVIAYPELMVKRPDDNSDGIVLNLHQKRLSYIVVVQWNDGSFVSEHVRWIWKPPWFRDSGNSFHQCCLVVSVTTIAAWHCIFCIMLIIRRSFQCTRLYLDLFISSLFAIQLKHDGSFKWSRIILEANRSNNADCIHLLFKSSLDTSVYCYEDKEYYSGSPLSPCVKAVQGKCITSVNWKWIVDLLSDYRCPCAPAGSITPFNFSLEMPLLPQQLMSALHMGKKSILYLDSNEQRLGSQSPNHAVVITCAFGAFSEAISEQFDYSSDRFVTLFAFMSDFLGKLCLLLLDPLKEICARMKLLIKELQKVLVVCFAAHQLGGKLNFKERGMSWIGPGSVLWQWASQWAISRPPHGVAEDIQEGKQLTEGGHRRTEHNRRLLPPALLPTSFFLLHLLLSSLL